MRLSTVSVGAMLRRAVDQKDKRCGAPTTWTVLQKHGPNHLGLRYNVLPAHQMALITSGFVPSRANTIHSLMADGEVTPRPSAAIPMANPHCSCKLTRVRPRCST